MTNIIRKLIVYPSLFTLFKPEDERNKGQTTELLCTFIEITLRHGCSPVNLLHIFRKHFL